MKQSNFCHLKFKPASNEVCSILSSDVEKKEMSFLFFELFSFCLTSNVYSFGCPIIYTDIGVFPKWSRTFIEFCEFNEFREADKSLKHELGSI